MPDLRQMVVFASTTSSRTPPFTRVDLVTCRNLLIYLQPAAQQKVLSLFHFALNRGGSSSSGRARPRARSARGFETLDKHWRSIASAATPASRSTRAFSPSRRPSRASRGAPSQPPGGRYSLSQLLGTYDALLERVMPPSLLVSERGELIHAFAGASRSCTTATAARASTSSSWSTPS